MLLDTATHMGLIYEPMQERTSVSDALFAARNVGIVLSGILPSARLSFAGGIFNDWFDAGEKLSENATQVIGRVTGLPLLSEDEGSLVHLGFGARLSNAKQGLRFQTEPEFMTAPIFVNTGSFSADRAITYDLELSARGGPIWIASEFVKVDVTAPSSGDPNFSGYHVTATWVATGEMRAYNKRSGILGPVPVARPVNQGGWGAWEFAARWSVLDLNDGVIEGGRMRHFSVGVNWWLTPAFSVSINYRNIRLDRFGTLGTADSLLARVSLLLE